VRSKIAELGSSFPHPFAEGSPNRITWKEALRVGGRVAPNRDKRIGEIRDERDLEGVPRDVPLKAIYVPEGDGVIRWGHPSHMNEVLGCMGYHDGFRCQGDALPAGTREGYITVTSSGEIVLHSPKQGGAMPGGAM
jgi:hypothetical protein